MKASMTPRGTGPTTRLATPVRRNQKRNREAAHGIGQQGRVVRCKQDRQLQV